VLLDKYESRVEYDAGERAAHTHQDLLRGDFRVSYEHVPIVASIGGVSTFAPKETAATGNDDRMSHRSERVVVRNTYGPLLFRTTVARSPRERVCNSFYRVSGTVVARHDARVCTDNRIGGGVEVIEPETNTRRYGKRMAAAKQTLRDGDETTDRKQTR